MGHYLITITILVTCYIITICASRNALKSSIYFATGIIKSFFRNCSLIILHDNAIGDFKEETELLIRTLQTYYHKDLFNFSPNVSKTFDRMNSIFKFRTVVKTYCSLVVAINDNVFDGISKAFDTHITAYENSLTNSDEDYYIFISTIENAHSILYSPLVLNLKYKLIISVISGSLNYTEEKSKKCKLRESIYCVCHSLAEKFHLRSDVLKKQKIGTLDTLFPDLMKSFNGHALRLTVATKLQAFLEIIKDKDGIWKLSRGLEKFLLETTMQKFNFTLRLFPSSGVDESTIGGTGSQLENETWIGCVGDILNDRADFSTTASPSVNRYLIVGFTAPFSYGWLTFITGKPEPTFSWKAIFKTFQITLWLLILSTFLVSTLILVIFEKTGKITLGTIIFKLFSTVVSQATRNPKKCPARVYFAFWLVFSMIMSTAFISKLVISLTFPEMQEHPTSFHDLVYSDYNWGLHGASCGGAGELYLKTSTQKVFKQLYKEMNLDSGDKDCFSQAQTKKFACVAYKQSIDYTLNKDYVDKSGNHDFFISFDNTMFLTTSWMIPKKALFKKQFDSVITWSRDVGLTEKWEKMDFARLRLNRFLKIDHSKNNYNCAYISSGHETSTHGKYPNVNRMMKRDAGHCSHAAVLNFENIIGSLSVLTIGYVISAVTFCGEIYIRRIYHNISSE